MTTYSGPMKVLEEFLQKNKYAAKGRRSPIKKSKLYNDIKKGLFVYKNEAAITEAEVLDYVHKAGLVRLEGNAGLLDRLREEEIQARVGAYRAREKKAKFDLAKEQGKYILREKWLTELVLKLHAAKQVPLNECRVRADELIEAVGGDLEKSQLLVEMFTCWIEDGFHELASVDELQFKVKRDPPPDKDKTLDAIVYTAMSSTGAEHWCRLDAKRLRAAADKIDLMLDDAKDIGDHHTTSERGPGGN